MASGTDMIELKNINPGAGNTRMALWKYDIYREAILKAMPDGPEGIRFTDLPKRVKELLPAAKLKELGSVSWHVTSVKLDLEARGLIERIPGAKP